MIDKDGIASIRRTSSMSAEEVGKSADEDRKELDNAWQVLRSMEKKC